jgi:hypothetical protein
MAKRTINQSTPIEVDDAAGTLSYYYADASTPPEAGGPGALVLVLQLVGSPKRHTKVIPAADLGKSIKLGEFLTALAAEALS